MATTTKYPVILKEKVPFISEMLFFVLAICCIILAICFFLFAPSLSSSNEMKVVGTTILIPNYVKWLILYSGIGFLIFNFLFKHVIIKKAGFLVFNPGSIAIRTKKNVYEIPISNIGRIELIDPADLNDISRGKFFVIIHEHNLKNLQFQLKEYYDSDEVVDNLLKYDGLKDLISNPERFTEPDVPGLEI